MRGGGGTHASGIHPPRHAPATPGCEAPWPNLRQLAIFAGVVRGVKVGAAASWGMGASPVAGYLGFSTRVVESVTAAGPAIHWKSSISVVESKS